MLEEEISTFALLLRDVWNQAPVEQDKGCISSQRLAVVFALQKQHVMLEGKCLTQFICCLVRKKNFWKLNRIIHVSSNFKMSKVMNINTGQMEALEHVKKNGKDIHSNKLGLISVSKKPGVATKRSIFSQPSVLGTGWRPEHASNACASANCCCQPADTAARARPRGLDGSGLLRQGRNQPLSKKCQCESDSVVTGITVSADLSVTQLLGRSRAGFGRYQARVNAWTWQYARWALA